jgi:hypothetical protein
MKIQKVKKQLKKINYLIETISDEGRFSTIEHDLLKSYIRELYEKVIEGKDIEPEMNSTFDIPEVKPAREKKKLREDSIFESIMSDPVIETKTQESIIPQNGTKAVSDIHSETSIHKVEVLHDHKTNESDHEVNELDELTIKIFSEDKTSDLSQKLSKMPLKDLNLAMGINERVFTVHELFKSNFSHFQEVVTTLNGFTNFEEAKKFLLQDVVYRYEWNTNRKHEQALEFVKLIRRRYI